MASHSPQTCGSRQEAVTAGDPWQFSLFEMSPAVWFMIRSFTSGYWARKEDCKKQNYIYTKHQQHQHQPDTICHYSQQIPEIQVEGRLQIINCNDNLRSCWWRDFIVTLKVFLLSMWLSSYTTGTFQETYWNVFTWCPTWWDQCVTCSVVSSTWTAPK